MYKGIMGNTFPLFAEEEASKNRIPSEKRY